MKRTIKIKVADLNQRNTWPVPGGLAVRPGLRKLYSSGTTTIVGGFSVRVPTTDEVWHYIVDVTGSAGGQSETRVLCLDANFIVYQALSVGFGRPPRAVTFAHVIGELLICSPDFPSVVGYAGGGLAIAKAVTSDTSRTALSMPRGLCVSWTSRSVVVDGAQISISDPRAITGGSIRTFVGNNVQWRSGVIYGLHVGAGGSLLVCTTEGVFALPESSAAAGQVALPNWQKLSTHRTVAFGTTCLASGRLYGLTKTGLRLIDVEDGPEVSLSESLSRRVLGPRVHLDDWRNAKVIAGDEGPIVSSRLVGGPFLPLDSSTGFRSWQTSVSAVSFGDVVGVLDQRDGEELLLTSTGVFRSVGDFDGGLSLASEVGEVQGWSAGAVPIPPEKSLTAASLTVGSAFTGGSLLATLNGTVLTGSDKTGTTNGLVIDGVASWGDGTSMRESSLVSRRGQVKINADEFSVEVGAVRGQTRLSPQCTLVVDGIDEDRPVNP